MKRAIFMHIRIIPELNLLLLHYMMRIIKGGSMKSEFNE